MNSNIDAELFRSTIEPWAPKAIQNIKKCCAEGANPNMICTEASTSRGHVRAGLSLLTHSIHEGASQAVEALLMCGADPNLKDTLGWTPWLSSTLAPDKKERIQALLKEYGAEEKDIHIEKLCRAIYDGDVKSAHASFQSIEDLKLLSVFRVDLVAHQILNKQSHMLAYLLDNGMPSDASQLYRSVRQGYAPAVELLLAHGISPDGCDDNETILMLAASIGNIDIVKMLVDAGADVERFAHDNIEWTAAFVAEKNKHKDVANYLKSKMSKSFIAMQKESLSSRNPKFRNLYRNATAAESLTTDDIIGVLEQWDNKYGIKVTRSDQRSITIKFETLPNNLSEFWLEVVDFCPDISDEMHAFVDRLEKKQVLSLWWD